MRSASRKLKYLWTVINNGIDPGHLLKHGQPHSDEQRTPHGRCPQCLPTLLHWRLQTVLDVREKLLNTVVVCIAAQHRLRIVPPGVRKEPARTFGNSKNHRQ